MGRERIRRFIVGSAAIALWCWVMAAGGPVSARTPSGIGWVPPIDAPIADPFRPPLSRYSAGNRGIEYAVAGGEAVVAVAAGRVTFIGAVGGSRFVVLSHPDGLRSTYAFVAEILVVKGQSVERGELIARASIGFHLTARSGDEYIDPALLFAGAVAAPRLVAGVPEQSGPGARADPVRVGPFDPLVALFDAGNDLTLTRQLSAIAQAAMAWRNQDCENDPTAPAPIGEPRTLIQVGGLGSSSVAASIGLLDVGALGYQAADVIGFSYAGGCTPVAFGGRGTPAGVSGALSGDLPSSDYKPEDTFQSVEYSADLLADLIEEAAIARPGQPIDLASHSLGGVVARRAVELLAQRGRLGGGPDALPVRVVLTVGSPHQGADLATASVAIEGNVTAVLIDRLTEYRGADAVRQLSEVGSMRLPEPAAPPSGVVAVAIAAATDLVVGAEHAIWPGATNVVIAPGTLAEVSDQGVSVHSSLPGQSEVADALVRAATGLRQRCASLGDLVTSTLVARGISTLEDLTTTVLGIERFL